MPPITAEFRQFVRGKSAIDEIEELVTALQVSVSGSVCASARLWALPLAAWRRKSRQRRMPGAGFAVKATA